MNKLQNALQFLKFLLIAFTSFNSYSQTWKSMQFEESSIISNLGATPKVATSTDGAVYLSFIDHNNSNKITVQKYNNGDFSTLGTAGFSESEGSYNDITVDKTGVPYVAYRDAGSSNKISVKRFYNGSWEIVGMQGFSVSAVTSICITSSPLDGVIYVAYSDGGSDNKVIVKKNIGSDWVNVGLSGLSSGASNLISLAISTTGVPYLIYNDKSLGDKAVVKKFDGLNWIDLTSNSVISSASVSDTDICISPSGEIYAAYITNNSTGIVKQYISGEWKTISKDSDFISAYEISIVIDSNGNPVVSYGGTDHIFTYKYTGTKWSAYASIAKTNAFNHDVSMASDGFPICVFTGYDNPLYPQSKIYLIKHISNSYSELKPPNISATSSLVLFNNLAVSSSGIPYISYYMPYDMKLQVKKYINGLWSSVGESLPAYSYYTNGPSMSKLVLNSAGVPYVSCTSLNKPTVKCFVDGQWVGLGSLTDAGITVGVDMDIDKADVPYIAYIKSGASCNSLVIKRFISNAWQDVGLKDIVNDVSMNSSPMIKISPDGNPFIIYTTCEGKVSVKKFDGSSWLNVGTPNISSTLPASTQLSVNIAFDKNSIPYILFSENSIYFLRKFISVSWFTVASVSNVSNANKSPHDDHSIKLIIGNGGIPYIAYRDLATSKLKIQKLNNFTWSDLDSNLYITNNSASYPSIASDFAGNIYTAFSGVIGNYAKVYGSLDLTPVKLVNYSVKYIGRSELTHSWTTASEQGNAYFQLEHSSDAENFSLVAKINSTGDNSKYSYVDNSAVTGINYYRLSQVDNDGKTTSLGIREVKVGLKSAVDAIYPNPLTTNTFTIELGSSAKQLERVQVIDQLGRNIAERFVKPEGNVLNVVLANKPAAGSYFVKLEGHPALKLIVQ